MTEEVMERGKPHIIMCSEEDEDEGREEIWVPDLGGHSVWAKIRDPGDGGVGPGAGPDHLAPFDQDLDTVLQSVFKFLTSRRDRNSASLVCTYWWKAEALTRPELFVGNCYAISPLRATERFPNVRSVVLKGKPRFADFNLVPPDWGAHASPWISAFSSRHMRIEKLCFKRMVISDSDLSLIAHSFPAFKELSIICSDGFTSAGLAAVAEKCRQLRVLDLSECCFEEDEEEGTDWISKFPSTATCLESLVFECLAGPVNLEALESLVARSPNLRRLRLNQEVSASQLHRLMSLAPHLTHLGTGSFKSLPADAAGGEADSLALAFAASTSIVCLSGFRGLSPELLPAVFPVCANLTWLDLSFAEISPEQLRPVILHCHNLQKFWVLATVRDEGMRMVAATCKDLRDLRVFPLDVSDDSDGFVSDVGLTAIAEGCPKLRSILYFCRRMTNAAVISMSKNCPDLAVFRLCIMGLHLPDHVTDEPMDEGFGAIVSNCKKLTRLSLSGLLTDTAFRYIGEHGKLVRTLSVAFAGDSDSGLRHVLEGCPELQKLEIRDCPFGDPGLISGLHQFYNMRFLWMSSCRLTVRGCREVAQRLPGMVLEVIRDDVENHDEELAGKLYMYRSLAGPRNDAPPFVKILHSNGEISSPIRALNRMSLI